VASLNRVSLLTARKFGSIAASVDLKALFQGTDTIDASVLKSVPIKALLASLHSERTPIDIWQSEFVNRVCMVAHLSVGSRDGGQTNIVQRFICVGDRQC
jgi:hypothetical protein